MALSQRKSHRAINANYEVFAPSAGVTAFAREAALFVALAVAGAANADPMVCRTEAGVTHCEAPLNHYRVIGTRKGNRTYFEDNKGRRWMMIEEDGRTTVMPR
jgi:hypothetical protein